MCAFCRNVNIFVNKLLVPLVCLVIIIFYIGKLFGAWQ